MASGRAWWRASGLAATALAWLKAVSRGDERPGDQQRDHVRVSQRQPASQGMGEAAHGQRIGPVTVMLRTGTNPGGLPIEVFDDLRAGLTADRSRFYEEFSPAR